MDLNKKQTFAVIGASNNKEKYGNKIFVDLIRKGFSIIPINPKEDNIEGIKCYHTIKEYDNNIDIIILVVPSKVGINIVKEAYDLGIKKVWMQPGSESEEIIDFCNEKQIEYELSCMIITT